MKKEVLVVAALLPFFSAVSQAADYKWSGAADGTYNNPGNWILDGSPAATAPGAGDAAQYDNAVTGASTITINGDWTVAWLRTNTRPIDLSQASMEQTSGTVTVTGGFQVSTGSINDSVYRLVDGTINIDGPSGSQGLIVANGGGKGTFIQNGGTVNVKSGKFGGGWGGTSASMTYELNGGELNFTSGSSVEFAWDGGTATFNQKGGTFNITGSGSAFQLGNGSRDGTSSKAYYSLEAGTLNVARNIHLGDQSGGAGEFNMSGGTFNHTGDWLVVGRGTNSVGTFTQTGGDFSTSATVELGRNGGTVGGVPTESVWRVATDATATTTFNNNVLIGQGGGKGRFIVDSGEVTFKGNVSVGHSGDGGGTGVLELNGGTVTAKLIASHADAVSSTVIFDGGTLKAANDAVVLITSDVDSVLVNAGGGTIDTNGVDVTIASNLSGSGDLEKTGTGILTLSGDNSAYEGALTVSAGGVVLDVAAWTFLVDGATKSAENAVIVGSGASVEVGYVDLYVTLSNASNLLVGDVIDVFQGASSLDSTNVNIISSDGAYAFSLQDDGKLLVTAVPEPSTYALLGAGLLAGLVALRRRKVS